MRVGLQDGGAGVRGGDRRVDRGAQVYGRTHRAGLIVGIHAASLRPACVSLLRPAPKPRRAWRASNVGVAWPGRAGPSRRPIIRVIPESAGILVPHVFVLCSPATVALDAEGRLYSPAYGDVYHSPAGALGQAEHVFLRGNGLPERWRGRDAFTVCETGFGLGLNFLALWRAWRDDPARSAVLHVLAVEGHPFALADLAALLARHAPAAGRPGARAGGPMAAAAAWLAPARVTAGPSR